MKLTFALLFAAVSLSSVSQTITLGELKIMKPKLGFTQVYADPDIQDLDLPGGITKYGADNTCGKIIRTLRFKNITDAVEARYNLPHCILLAMIMEETTGADLLPNAHSDGGFGLIHMQPVNAVEFGLTTYGGCDKMVCRKHSKGLEELLDENHYDRRKVYRYDDRLHPVLNVDAAGRMVAYYLALPPIKGMTPLQSAVCRYAGSHNYEKYLEHISLYAAYLRNPSALAQAESLFNRLNKGYVINGKPSSFQRYLQICRQQNYNYGLAKYQKLPRYVIKNSKKAKEGFEKIIVSKTKILKPLCK